MGAGCTKQCLHHVPDTRRRPAKTKARLQPWEASGALSQVGTPPANNLCERSSRDRRQCDCMRVRSLRDTAFRSGFHLGLKVRKLERLLKAADAGDYSRSEPSAAVLVNEREAAQLKKDVPVIPVPLDESLTQVVAHDQHDVAGQVVPHSFELLLKDDFKWVVEPELRDSCSASLP